MQKFPSSLDNYHLFTYLYLDSFKKYILHAYRLAKIANEIVGPEEQISTGTLSSLLSKLLQAEMITPAEPGISPFPSDRPSRVFAITPVGRERFFELMLDIASHQGAYHKLFHIKALHLEFLPLDLQLYLVENYLTHCRQILRSKQADKEDVTRSPIKQEYMNTALREAAFALMRLKTGQWRLELEWGEALREQILSRLKQGEGTAITGSEQ